MILPSPSAIWREGRILRAWKRVANHSDRTILDRRSGIELVSYRIPAARGPWTGKRILFLSDTHFSRGDFHPDGGAGIEKAVRALATIARPDIVLFGGDLCSSKSLFERGADFLSAVKPSSILKGQALFALGNWDRKGRGRNGDRVMARALSEKGWLLLVNESLRIDDAGILVYCLDEPRTGRPAFPPFTDDRQAFRVLVSHNPDALVSFDGELGAFDLVLCGHTHGGQLRFPGIGPLITSSLYGRRFDYGLSRRRPLGPHLVVSSGLGSSGLPVRLGCPREMALIEIA